MKKRFSLLTALVLSAAILSGCASGDSSSEKDSSSDSKETTTAATVTLPQDSSSVPEESSDSGSDNNESQPDSSGTDDPDTQPAGDSCTPLMWKITAENGSEIVFMGSMHALKPEIYPLPERIMNAYTSAEVLAVECDITSVTDNFAAQLELLRQMTYSKGETIEDHLSAETIENLKGFLEANGYSFDMFKSYKPWALSSVVEEIILGKTDLDYAQGIDSFLLNTAHEDGKEIYEVESYEFQSQLLMNFSDEIQDVTLSSYSTENEEELVTQMKDTYEAWKGGDITEVEELLLEDESDYEDLTDEQIALIEDYNKQMLYDRNIGMADAAEKLLKEHSNTFFVVGLAHFIGDGGIIDLLEQRGYTVEQI